MDFIEIAGVVVVVVVVVFFDHIEKKSHAVKYNIV